MKTGKSKQFVARAALMTLATVAVHAQAAIWNGSTANWSDHTKWSDGVVPNSATSDAIVNSGAPNLDAQFTVRDFTFSGGTLSASAGGALTVGGNFRYSGGVVASPASINVTGAAALSGMLTNAGTINFQQSPLSDDLMQLSTGPSGVIKLGSGVQLNLFNSSTTAGTISGTAARLTIAESSNADAVHTFSGSARVAVGTFSATDSLLNIENNALVTAGSFNVNGGLSGLSGSGTIDAPAEMNQTTITPGDADGETGILHFKQALTITNSPVFAFDMDASAVQPVDRIDADGTLAVVDPYLALNLPDGATAPTSGTFTIAHSGVVGGLSGTLDPSCLDENGLVPLLDSNGDTVEEFSVQYTGQDIRLVTVPEPALALALGALGLLASRRRTFAA